MKVPKCGGYEIRFQEGSESRFFYWDDLPSISSRANRLWSWPRHLHGLSATRMA